MSSKISINNYSVTGDCSSTNSGAFSFNIGSSAPPFTINWINPAFGTVIINTSPYNYSLTGLSGGTYTFTITDSGIPPYTSPPRNLYISTGTCVSIDSIENTTCNLDNGSLTASTSTLYGPYAEFYLYETTTGYVTSAQTNTQTTVFNSLSAGTYYVIGDDGGGCTGMSESCIIKSSTTLTYDFYIVDDANCAGSGSGAVYVTNLNGTPPYTYSWLPGGETTSYITGKTSGTYSVIVTDSSNCSVTDSAIITNVPPIGIGLVTSVAPTCFSNNGSITVTITGGTPPYYFSGSNGDSIVTVGQTYTFANLASGYFEYIIKDLGFCSASSSLALIAPTGFNVINITTVNSQCANGQGQIEVEVAGGVGNYTYTLTDSTSSVVESAIVPDTFYIFQNLYSDTYQLTISGGGCVYTTSVTVNNNEFLDIDYSLTGATCESCNGSIELMAIGGTGSYTYNIVGPTYSYTTPVLSTTAYTFTDLCPGTYTATIKDQGVNKCNVSTSIILPTTPDVYFSLNAINPSPISNNGSLTALITSGTAPFTLNWSSNVNGQTGITVSNLSAGTYTLQVVDNNGCTFDRTVELVGYVPLNSYQIFTICSDDFTNTGLLLTKGPKQMLNEGFYDLTSGDTNCILNMAYFTAVVTVDGVTKTDTFYIGTNLNDYPSDETWTAVIENLLLSFDGITGVTTNIQENIITITTPCFTLDNSQVKIDLLINYDISCESIEPPVPCTCYALVDMGGLPGAQEVTFTNCYTSEEQTIQFAGINALPSKFPYFCSQTKPIRYDGLTANTFYISASTCDNCCRCYIMSGNSTGIDPTGTTYQYLDCNGVSNVVDLAPDEELSVCASVIPWRLSTDNIGNIYSNSGSGGANYFPLCTGSPPSCPT